MFYRLSPDGSRRELDLVDFYAGPTPAPCWMIGGGPSLVDLPTAEIAASAAPKFAVNLAGHGLLRPDFWTSYDPTSRFQRSIYLDPSITKFVHRSRAMDLVPETTFKVCEAPATLFFDRAGQRGYHDFPAGSAGWTRPDGGPAPSSDAVTDWQDSLIQAIDIAWRIGFRTLYLAGCDMCVRPGGALLNSAAAAGVVYRRGELLKDFLDRCRQQGLASDEVDPALLAAQYHFEEAKPLAAAVQTDLHYFRVAQYLRLSRRAMALAGLRLVSVTPHSRLNDHFEYQPIDVALTDIRRLIGDPHAEPTRGKYTSRPALGDQHFGPMRDLPPHNWSKAKPAPSPAALPPSRPADQRARLRAALAELPEIAVPRD